MDSELVVAVYNENTSWIMDAMQTNKISKVFLYNKGSKDIELNDPRIEVIEKENIGREGETFLSHIINNWYNLSENIWFCQGDPFEHSPDFIGLIDSHDEYKLYPYWPMSFKYTDKDNVPPKELLDMNNKDYIHNFRSANYFIQNMQVVGHCSFIDLPLYGAIEDFREKYGAYDIFGYLSQRLGLAKPGPITDFAYGACLFTKGSCIRRNNISVYKELYRFLLESHKQASFQGYVVERYWPYLLTGRSYFSLTDCYKDILSSSPRVGVWNHDQKLFFTKKKLGWYEILPCNSSVICFYDEKSKTTKFLPNIVLYDRSNTHSSKCDSLEMAKNIILNSVL